MKTEIKVLKGSTIPAFQTPGAAAVDLHAVSEEVLYPRDTRLIQTNLKAAIPKGFAGLVCSRSGLALKNSVFVLNAPGIIDADFRGEVGVILHNAGENKFHVKPGDRIAQFMIVPIAEVEYVEVDELDETERGSNGFGSTGV